MMRSRLHWIPTAAAMGLLVLTVVGCGGLLPSPDVTDPSPTVDVALPADDFGSTIEVDNGTNLGISIVVNGTRLIVVPAHQHGTVKPGLLPAQPWAVEAMTGSGRRLLAFGVQPGQVQRRDLPDGSTEMVGAGSRVDLSCGRLDVYVGPPLLGPAPGPGRPGDCVP